jgi:sugar phosphate isomerase/epimerase
MHLGIISDEVHRSFETACAQIASWGLPLVEVRTVDGRNITLLPDAEIARVADIVAGHGLLVSGVASPVFKSALDERPSTTASDFAVPGLVSVADNLALLERACAVAQRLGTRLVRVFTFFRIPWEEAAGDRLRTAFIRAATIAKVHGVVLAVENEPVCVVATGAELGRFFQWLDEGLPAELKPHLMALWDPGNALSAGEGRPYPDGYRALDPSSIAHVHLKDLGDQPGSIGSFVPIDQGRIDYRGQLAALLADGYTGSVVLEPHYAPPGRDPLEAAHDCVRAAQRRLADAALAQ